MSMSITDARTLADTGAVSPRAAAFLHATNGKGQFVSITLHTTVTLSAAARKAGHVIEKIQTITTGTTTGKEYKNLAQNSDRVTGPLPNGQEWVIYPWISRSADGATEYARVYVDSRTAHYDTTYFIDGVNVGDNWQGREAVKNSGHLTAGAKAKMDEPKDPDADPVYTMGPKIQNVVAVNGITL